MYCSNCGREIGKKDKYCPNCGWENALYDPNDTKEEVIEADLFEKQEEKKEEPKQENKSSKSINKVLGILSIVLGFFVSLLGLGFGIYVTAVEKDPEIRKLGIIGIVIFSVMAILEIILIIVFYDFVIEILKQIMPYY